MAEDWQGDPPPEPRSFRLALIYLWRAMRLQCPVCGRSPIFIPFWRTRSVMDWFTPLDGCPRCGFPYEREPGYFLFSLFVLNFGFVVSVALVTYIFLEYYANVSTAVLLIGTGLPAPFVAILIARHAKALFIAVDHFFDPFIRESVGDDDSGRGGDDGDLRLDRPPSGGGAPARHRHDYEDEIAHGPADPARSSAEFIGAGRE
jgi:uncharacterized protein (DUF983 family)